MPTHVYMHGFSVYVEVREQFRKRFLSFHHVGTRDGAEVIRHLPLLGICCPPPLHLMYLWCVSVYICDHVWQRGAQK